MIIEQLLGIKSHNKIEERSNVLNQQLQEFNMRKIWVQQTKIEMKPTTTSSYVIFSLRKVLPSQGTKFSGQINGELN